jgi:FMN-dependent oxidoreductase (nitrilotriacetate monooxygenase family)
VSGPARDELVLNVTAMGLGMHPSAWRLRGDAAATDFLSLQHFAGLARTAERGRLHAVFLADTLAAGEERFERPPLGALDPVVALTAMAASTTRIGLVATASTTYNHPFDLARRFASLDHLSGGRAGWNAVTTFVPDVARNFGTEALPDSAARYDRAQEFVEVVLALWASWEDGALTGDAATGRFADAARIHAIDHHGEHFDVAGPLTLPRSPQGRPVLFQAGSSERGRDLAGRYADVVFTAQNVLSAAQEFRADVKRRAREHGRDPRGVKVLPGLLPIVGSTEAEAQERKRALDEVGGHGAELNKLALRVGVPVEALELDAPLPVDLIEANTGFRGSEGFRNAAVRLAVEERLTVRELLARNGGGHLQVVGAPEQIADAIESWHAAGAADGFNLMIDVLPSGLEDVVDHVVPLLQRRGIFHHEYAGATLRENLGLSDV